MKKKIIPQKVARNYLIIFCFIFLCLLINSCGIILGNGKLKDGDYIEFKKNENKNIIYFFGSSEPQKILFTFEAIGTIIDPIIFEDHKRCLLHLRIKGEVTTSIWMVDGIKGVIYKVFTGSNTFGIDKSMKYLCIFDGVDSDQDFSGQLNVRKLIIYIYSFDLSNFVKEFSLPFYKYPIWYTKSGTQESTEPYYDEKNNSFYFKIINYENFVETYQISLDSMKMDRIDIDKIPNDFYFGM